MKINSNIIASLSAAFTLATCAGLLATAWFVFPAAEPAKRQSRLDTSVSPKPAPAVTPAGAEKRASANLAPSVPAPVSQPRLPAPLPAVEARAVAAQEPVVKQEAAELEVLAARKPRTEPSEVGPKAPESQWDGKPLPQDSNIGQPTVPNKPAAHPAPAAKSVPTPPPAAPATTAPASNPSEPAAAVETPPPPPIDEWSPIEIADALKECLKLLGPVDAEIEPVDAMRKGPCGAPAPIKLKSVGRDNRIEFTPAIEVNCKLAVGIAEWSDKVLQPAAKSVLGSRVTRISGASGYACRNRYGLANAPLSEHALANAVDVPAFVLADGRTVRVKAGWGATARDLLKAKSEALAAAKSGVAPKADAAKATAEQVTPAAGARTVDASRDAKSKDRSGIDQKDLELASKDAKAKGAKSKTGKGRDTGSDADSEASQHVDAADDRRKGQRGGRDPAAKLEKVAALKGAGAQRLGAAPASDAKPAPAPEAVEPGKVTSEGRFLRLIAKGACETFGTMLGPEANEAHRDHFHFDMKARRYKAYCQ